MAVDSAYAEWLDSAVSFYRQRFYVLHGTDPSAVWVDLASLANAGLQQTTAGETNFVASSPIDAQYPTIVQIAVLNFGCADGSVIQMVIPAPISSIFLPDGFRIDPTVCATLIADVINDVTNHLGSPVITYLSGTLVNRKRDIP